MPKRSLPSVAAPRNAFILGALLVAACGSDGADATSPMGQAGASAGGAPTSAGASGNSAGAANPGAGATNVAGAANGAAGASAGGAASAGAGAPSAGASAGGASGAGTAGAGTAGAGTTGDLWVATDGNDANAGTEAKPLLNLPNALVKITPGHTIWLKAGTYKYGASLQLKKSGTAALPYTIAGAPGTRPILNFVTPAAVRGFDIQGDYWHLKTLEVENATDNCVAISGSHNTIEDLTIHNCGDTGLQITVGSAQVADATRGANNLILNCDSYLNFDAATNGENADGFAAKLRIGAGNVFRGCRAYNNADDGWDLFAADDVVEIDDCWAFSNGKGLSGNNPAGDGNGFKLGGKPTSEGEGGAVHLVKGCFAFENLACGYTQNSNPDVPKLSACGAKDNKDDYCQTLSKSGEASMTLTAAQAKAVKRNADGSLPPMK